jgi:glutamate 5-kinase
MPRPPSPIPPILAAAKRVVVKVGSALLVDPHSRALRRDWMASLAADLATARARGQEVLVVSSGAIALGRRVLELPAGMLTLEQSQAAAAVGQIRLARAWEEALEPHGLKTAQVLLTLEDTQDRRRYLNSRATLATLLKLGVVPIVNENDTVATDEIRYGDNDRLAARAALTTGADALVLLSDIDGLYTADPRRDPSAKRLDLVREITPLIEAMATGSASETARGGMTTKLLAAKIALQGGCAMAIAPGAPLHPLAQLERGGPATWFVPHTSPSAARKQWIAGLKPQGVLVVDAGAAAALRQGKSLLPAGLVRVEGEFERGDAVALQGVDGAALGVALAGYAAAEAGRIAGLQSGAIADVLGHPGRAVLAHREDLVIWGA